MLHFLNYTAIKQTNKTNEQSFIQLLEHVQTFGLGYKIVRTH